MKKLIPLKENQNGLVAITVTVFFMLVLSLIVLAFSQTTRREQRQTLDRQLSSQAYYAAESGINDAIQWIKNHPGENITNCTDSGSWSDPANHGGTTVSQSLDSGTTPTFSYQCLLIDQEPVELSFGSIDLEDGQTISLGTKAGQPLKSVTFTWNEKTAPGVSADNFSGCVNATQVLKFEPNDKYSPDCDAGMLRIYIMPVSAGAKRQDLVNGSFSAFLRPVSGIGHNSTVNYDLYGNSEEQGRVIPATCTNGGACSATIDNINTVGAGKVYLHLRSIYRENTVTITGISALGGPVNFNDEQAMIDSTGRANDVLRRVQVRVPLRETFTRSPYTLNAMNGICKKLSVYPGFSQSADCGSASDEGSEDSD